LILHGGLQCPSGEILVGVVAKQARFATSDPPTAIRHIVATSDDAQPCNFIHRGVSPAAASCPSEGCGLIGMQPSGMMMAYFMVG
jgi:hypothetical protein